jgi:hypothetical protein
MPGDIRRVSLVTSCVLPVSSLKISSVVSTGQPETEIRKDADGEPIKDAERFSLAVSQIVGKLLTWNRLTAKEGEPRPTE